MDAAVTETHISTVFFVGDRAYKLKKAVRFPFVDLTGREARERICRREVELNRRLAPDVYLGVADVVGPDGEVCDHLVVMRRMPADRRLSTLARSDPDVRGCVDATARTVAAFHREARRSAEIAAAGSPEAIERLWRSNVDEMRPLVDRRVDGDALDDVDELSRRYVVGRRRLFQDRMDAGRIVDGHGDLLADDIFCLDDGPRILDCIEFADSFRHGDVLADVAFLAMDLERIGVPGLATRFLETYREASGEHWPTSLEHHYVAYRALVRSKIACLRAEQTASDDDEGERLLELCRAHLRAGRVRLVLVGGLPGTGKTTLARAVARARGWSVLSSDETRKRRAGLPRDADAAAGWRSELYADEVTDATYATLLDDAEALLGGGRSVVLDASWTSAKRRAAARSTARRTDADLVELRCVVDAKTAAERIHTRRVRGGDASDATEEVASRLAAVADPWPQAAPVDTSPAPEETLRRALAVVDEPTRTSQRP